MENLLQLLLLGVGLSSKLFIICFAYALYLYISKKLPYLVHITLSQQSRKQYIHNEIQTYVLWGLICFMMSLYLYFFVSTQQFSIFNILVFILYFILLLLVHIRRMKIRKEICDGIIYYN